MDGFEDQEENTSKDEGLEAMELLFRLRVARIIMLIHLLFVTCFIVVVLHSFVYDGDSIYHYVIIILIVVFDNIACAFHRKRAWSRYWDVVGSKN